VSLAGLGIALAVSIFLAPLALMSPEHDGLEHVGTTLKFIDEESTAAPILPAPIPDYEMPGLAWKPLAVSAAGAVGTLVVFGVALTLARAFTPGKTRSGVVVDAA
jgi:hypothetical protein